MEVGKDLLRLWKKPHVTCETDGLCSQLEVKAMNLLIREPRRFFRNVHQIAAFGANGRSRRQLRWNMIQANLKRTHHGWLRVANRLLGAKPVTVELKFGEATIPFSYRPGSTDLLVLEQVFLQR